MSPADRPLQRVSAGLPLLLAVAMLAGCGIFPGSPASVTVSSEVDDARRITDTFNHAIYGFNDEDRLTVVLLRGPREDPTAAVTIRMFWAPAAGRTPISPNATNASIQYLVFGQTPELDAAEPDGIGIYDGGGYLYLDSTPGAGTLTASVWQADLRLRDASERFTDQLGQATLVTDLTARRDDQAVLSLLRQLSDRATRRLGYPRLVDTADGDALARRD